MSPPSLVTSTLLGVLAMLAPQRALAVLAPTGGASVELSGPRAMGLLEPTESGIAPGPRAATRSVRLQRRGERLELRVRWDLDADKPGWFAGELVRGDVRVRSVTIGGRPAATAADASATYVAAWIDGPTTLELVADLRGDPSRGPVPLALLAATRGTATVAGEPTWRFEAPDPTTGAAIHLGASISTAPGLRGSSPATPGITHGAPTELQLVVRTPPVPDASVLAHGRIGVGLFVGDAEIRGRARLQWTLRRGELARVAFVARGVGEDFTVVGPDVREVTRTGDMVQVELQGPVASVVALEATWSQRTPPGEATVVPPVFELQDASRTDASFELGRDGDVDVVPELPGWRQVAAVQLPAWGRDLIEGTPAAAWTRHGTAEAGRLQLLRFIPVEAPKVVIGEASFDLASADHGTTLVKARYEVLNERASHLRVVPPPSSRVLAIEVAGTDARVARDGDALLVPIPRSLETMEGLVAIPVVVSLAVTERAWKRREHRELPLPSVDAPIRAVTAKWLLPRDVRATIDVGDDGVASIARAPSPQRHRRAYRRATKNATMIEAYDFDDGSLGGATAGPSSAEPSGSTELDQAETDRLLREAQESYNRNEFDDAQLRLDELRDRGLADEDAKKLQSNLDIVNAPAPAPIEASPISGEMILQSSSSSSSTPRPEKAGIFRRIKDQARARGQKQVLENATRKKKAKELRAKGDYAAAEAEYKQVIEENRKLENLEQEESATIDFENDELEAELESTKTEAAARSAIDAQSSTKFAPSFDAEDGELGLGAAWITTASALDVARTPTPSPANDGPRVLMPTRGGDTVVYAFDLWAPGSRHALVVEAKRRRPRP